MPRKFTYVDNSISYAYILPSDVTFPKSKDLNDLSDPKAFNRFLKTHFITSLLPMLSKLLFKYYKHRFKLQSGTAHKFLIENLKANEQYYLIRLASIKNVFMIPRKNENQLGNNSYAVIKHSFDNQTNAKIAATEYILDGVKDDLLAYCKEAQLALDEEKGLLGKYHKVDAWADSDNQKKLDKQKRQVFLNSKFDQFYIMLKTLLLDLTEVDIQSINFDKPTLNAARFISFFHWLNTAGFYNVNDKPINFWSGPEAQVYANETLNSLSDGNVPATNIMMHLGKLLLQQRPTLSALLCGGSSAVFASQARGNVVVYNSSNFNKEEGVVLTAGNFHWENELPILQRKNQAGEIHLKISFYNREYNTWDDPVPLSRKNRFNIVRRESYKCPHNKDLHDRNPSIYHWHTNKGRPRTVVSIDTISRCFNKWRFYKKLQSQPDRILSETMAHWLTYKKQ